MPPWGSDIPIGQALREAALALAPVSDTARLDAELLLAEALGVTRSELLLRHTGDAVPPGFAALIERRLEHEPVAYILGRQEFYGRTFAVDPCVLIPRPDSEATVQAALDGCADPPRVLDCGIGSGALLLTILAERAGAEGVGIDRSADALAIAARNAARLGLGARTRLLCRDWHEAGWSTGLGRFDVIVANPPYVESGAALARSVREHEPPGALFAGPEGLDDYRVLLPRLPGLLEPHGIAVVEIGAAQAGPVTKIAAEAGFSAELHRDLAERARVLVLRLGVGKPRRNV